jgi:hypothetical protein
MAHASDLPLELYYLILSFLPENHEQQIEWRQRVAAVGQGWPDIAQ